MKSLFFRSFFVGITIFSTLLFANIGGKVFEDLPNQVYGVKESNEVGVANFEVLVTDAQGHSQTITTDSNGMWSSTLSAPVRVEFKNCDSCANPTQFDIDSKGSVVLVDEDSNNINFGVYPKGNYKNSANGDKEPIEVGNLVWDDSDGDGLQSAGEKGIAGVAVELYCNGELVDTAKTDENGYYLFSTDNSKSNTESLRYGLGNYLKENNSNNCKIVIGEQGALANVVLTDSFKGDNPLLDSNGELVGDSVKIKIPNTLKAGKYDYDLDVGFKPCNVCIGDFVWNDTNKNGIQDNGEKGIKGVFVTLLNEDGSVNNTVQTDKDGKYKFCELFNGEKYKIQVQLPDTSYEFSPKNQGDDKTKDSDVNNNGKSDLITIGRDDDFSIDAGVHKVPQNSYCIGDFVWNDKNRNGIQDNNESCIKGVSISLLKDNGTLVKTVQTDDSGKYSFCGLKSGDKYKIKVQLPNATYEFSPKEQGSDSQKDSNVDNNGSSDVIVIGNSDDFSIDAGVFVSKPIIDNNPKTHCLGSKYWFDSNLNGVYDANEQGVRDIKVELYDENKTLIATTKADRNGIYKFCGLKDGKYYVKFDLPDAYKFIYKHHGDKSKDSDANNDGWSDLITIDGADVNNIDAGIYCSCDEGKVKGWKKVSASVSAYGVVAFILLLISLTFRRK